MKNNYDDIIGLSHHVSQNRPHMNAHDRAAQFAPFSALTGYGAIVSEEARKTDLRIELDEYEKELINSRILRIIELIEDYPQIRATYFLPDERKSGGCYVSIDGCVETVDEYEKTLILTDASVIPIEDLISITIKENREN